MARYIDERYDEVARYQCQLLHLALEDDAEEEAGRHEQKKADDDLIALAFSL